MKDNMDDTNQDINADDVQYDTVDENTTDDTNNQNDNKGKSEDLEQDNLDKEDKEGDNSEQEGEQEPKKKNPVQARIDELTRKQKEALELAQKHEAEAKFWREEAESKQKPEAALVEPDRLNYDTDEDYNKAVKTFLKEEAKREVEQEINTKNAHQIYEKTIQEASKISDYNEVIERANSYGTVASQTLNDAILHSEHGALLAYEIAKDPYNAVRISKLAINNPPQFYREIGKLEAKLSSSKSLDLNNIKKNMPKPPTPLNNNEKTNTHFMNMPLEDYMRKK